MDHKVKLAKDNVSFGITPVKGNHVIFLNPDNPEVTFKDGQIEPYMVSIEKLIERGYVTLEEVGGKETKKAETKKVEPEKKVEEKKVEPEKIEETKDEEIVDKVDAEEKVEEPIKSSKDKKKKKDK